MMFFNCNSICVTAFEFRSKIALDDLMTKFEKNRLLAAPPLIYAPES